MGSRTDVERCRQRFRQIIGALPCAYIHGEVFVNGKGEATDYAVKDVNHAFEDVTCLSRDKVLGKRIAGLFSMKSVKQDIEVFSRVAITGDPQEKEFLSPFFGVYFRLFSFSPEKGQFVALLTDLSTEKKFREKTEFLSSFSNSTTDEFYVLDRAGHFVFGNSAVAAHLGVDQKNIPGKHISLLNPIAEKSWWDTLWKSLMQKGSLQFETEHYTPSGGTFPVELSVDIMENSGQKYAAVVSKNISSKRALSTALLNDQRYAERAASTAGYMIWLIDPSGHFRPILGGENEFVHGPVEEVFFSRVHPEDREEFLGRVNSFPEGSYDLRLRTGKGLAFHRAVWSRTDDSCTTGIFYPVSGSRLSGHGSSSAVMDTYCRVLDSLYSKISRLRDFLDSGNQAGALKTANTMVHEFGYLTGHGSSPERVRLDRFLKNGTGMFRQLLGVMTPLQVEVDGCVSGLVDPSILENALVRLLMIVQATGRAERVFLQPEKAGGTAGVRLSVHGSEGIQNALDDLFIPVNKTVPGLASVYAMVRSAGGRVVFETKDNQVDFVLWFHEARMNDDSASVIIALSDRVDAARSYAALRDAGYAVALETDAHEIKRMINEEGAGVLVVSSSLMDYTADGFSREADSVSIIQVGGKPEATWISPLPEGFRTGELVSLVRKVLFRAEKPREADLQGSTPLKGFHQTPPLF